MSATATAERPAHVTDAVFYDFDMFRDSAYLADPHARIRNLYEVAPPIFWTPRNGGHWMLVSHEANFSASRDTESFSSEVMPREQMANVKAAMPAGTPHIPMPIPICMDPPEHAQYRAPLNAAFSPKAMMALRDGIRTLAADLIEAMKPSGTADFQAEVAEPLPVQVFLKMFGLPLERQRQYRDVVKAHMAAMSDPDPKEMVQRMFRVIDIMRDTVLDRRDNPQDDLISLLWQAGIGGKPTTLDDMDDYCILLFTAGLDTVMNGIGHGVHHLATHPELQRQLRESPKLIPEAAEELLRRYTFTVPPRRVAKDIIFLGVEMKANDRAMLFLPGADLDPAEYPDPDVYDLKRENNVHIAFGTGPHRCLGSHLARIELQILYEELLARLPEFGLDPAHPVTYHGGHVIGPETLWLKWNV